MSFSRQSIDSQFRLPRKRFDLITSGSKSENTMKETNEKENAISLN